MKRTCYCFIAFVLFLFISSPAHSYDLHTYILANAGYTMLEDLEMTDEFFEYNLEYDPGYFVGVAVGHHFQNFRGELELGLQKNVIDSVSVNDGPSVSQDSDDEIRLLSLLFNMYYDFNNRSALTPYLTAGIGLGNVKVDGSNESDPVSEFQAGAGLAIKFNDKFALDLKYRYLSTSEVEISGMKFDYTTHNAILGLRYYFD